MPISRGSHISRIIEEVKMINPNSILDVGVGWGLMGAIFRAYTDIRLSELDESRYHHWQTRIDGVEVFRKYDNYMWMGYDSVIKKDITDSLFDLPVKKYDLIYMGDVIEHLEKYRGQALIESLLERCKYLIIATPSPAPKQGEVLGNKFEEHLSSWDESDFGDYHHEILGNFGGILCVKLWQRE